jgi:hypothetical protein
MTQTQTNTPPLSHGVHPSLFSQFDRLVLFIIVGLIVAIGLVVLLGDRVGVQLRGAGPVGQASSTAPIYVQFNEAMNWESVVERFSIQPEIGGDFSWTGTTMRFQPNTALEPGADYTVYLENGAQSESGRPLLSDITFSFTIRRPQVAYLTPADSIPQNVWIADPSDPSSAKQITFSPSGVINFDISPDGRQIAFSERNSTTGTSDIKLLTIETGELQQVTNCADADCTTPTFRPNGNMIAYERVDFNTDLGNIGVSPTRVWLIDLTVTPATTRPLFSDSQILGYSPQWSANGDRIAVFDNTNQGILVYDFTNENILVIPSRYGSAGVFSPDGNRVVFPELLLIEGQEARSYLKMADLETGETTNLSNPDEPVDDSQAAWSPDGQHVAISRRYVDDRYTRTRQIYLLNVDDLSVETLIFEERYANGVFVWDPNGEALVLQRFPELDENGQPNPSARPEIWTYDLASETLTQVATNAYLPRWVP